MRALPVKLLRYWFNSIGGTYLAMIDSRWMVMNDIEEFTHCHLFSVDQFYHTLTKIKSPWSLYFIKASFWIWKFQNIFIIFYFIICVKERTLHMHIKCEIIWTPGTCFRKRDSVWVCVKDLVLQIFIWNVLHVQENRPKFMNKK